MVHQSSEFPFTPENMFSDISFFAEKISLFSKRIGIEADSLTLDHVAMRLNCLADAMQAEQEWKEIGRELSRAEINGRPIVVIELNRPIDIGIWQTDCVELPYPTINKHYPVQGWEHVEFVVPCSAETIEDFVAVVRSKFSRLNQLWEQLTELRVSVKLSQPAGENERLANPTIAFKWEGVTIKLHPYSLKEVIQSEQTR